jgi:hypothetical protein
VSDSSAFKDQILRELRARYRFKKPDGKWMQEGECPDCRKWQVYCSSEDPKVVACGRGSCGYKESVRDILTDLFEDWSKRVKPTRENPNATADEYLRTGRGLDLAGLRGHFTQELFKDQDSGATTATVRFPLPGDSWWERLIDRPGRFGKKARFKYGSKPGGHCWAHPEDTFEVLAGMDEIWIAEGIFDALALRQNFKRLEKEGRKRKCTAVSAMSSNFWPEHFLASLRTALAGARRTPEIVFAFDVGYAGVEAMKEFTARAIREHWEAGAAIVTVDGEGAKRDWNDLLLLQFGHRGAEEYGPLSSASLERYRENGAITLAKTPQEKANLLAQKLVLSAFDFRFDNRTYWAARKGDDDDDGGDSAKKIAREIANCAFRVLYRERDEVADETTYFLQVDFPGKRPTQKARFAHSALADSGAFKKRLMAFAGTWSGNGEQLDRIIKNQPGLDKVVTPIKFTGYSAEHTAWVLGDLAIREGRVHQINRDKFFDFGRQAVKLRSDDRLLRIAYDPDSLAFDWLPDLWAAYGEKGFVALAFFVLSLFAQQVRNAPLWHSSLPFLEVTGLPGSGKTTLVVFLHKLLGRGGANGHEGYDPNKVSPAALGRILMRVANLPEGLIEGQRGGDDKAQRNRQFDYNELLVLYDGRNPRATGQKSDGYEVNEQPFLGTLYLMQNERIDAHPAVLERLVSMNIGKERHSEAGREASDRLSQWPIDDLSGSIVHIVRQEAAFLAQFKARYATHTAEMGKRVQGLVNRRIIKNHAQLAATVECLPALFKGVRPEWVAETLEQIDRLALDRQNSAGADHPIVAAFWEKVDYLLARERADAHEQGESLNQHRDRERMLAINLPHFESRCHQAGLERPNMDLLKKLLRNSHSRKWRATKPVNNPAGRSTLCWVFERPLHEQPII